jgi:hypothetical protein
MRSKRGMKKQCPQTLNPARLGNATGDALSIPSLFESRDSSMNEPGLCDYVGTYLWILFYNFCMYKITILV